MTYIIISPVKNEEGYIEQTIRSVLAQTLRPDKWMIVDDGSSDSTGAIIEKYARDHPWIKYVSLPDRGYRPGGGIVKAFYAGFSPDEAADMDLVVKMDGDITFGNTFFENIFSEFDRDPGLGIASGTQYHDTVAGKETLYDVPEDYVCGPLKVYRKKCFDEIGGLREGMGWDIADMIAAGYRGWRTRTIPTLRYTHLRATGSRDGLLRGRLRHGESAYVTGYAPAYFILRCLYRIFERPYVLGSIFLLGGYLGALFARKHKLVSTDEEKWHRKRQLSKMGDMRFWRPYFRRR